MAEGRVYRCSWKKVGTQYRLWVTRKPKLIGEGRSFSAARETLWGAVCTELGDGEAIFEFDPAEPMSDVVRRLRNPAIVTVVGNTRADIKGDPDALFKGGLCPQCRAPRGPRTAVPLSVESIESGYEGAFTSVALISLFSEDFLSLLTRKERDRYEWRPVLRGGRAKKAFYELIAQPTVPLVAMRGLDYRRHLQCDTCERRSDPMYYPAHGQDQTLRDAGISTFVSRADLPDPLPAWFIVGSPPRYSLGVRQERWQELTGKRGTRGLVSTPIGVLDRTQVARNLVFEKRSVADRVAARMMAELKKLIAKKH